MNTLFLKDLTERVVATFLGALIPLATANATDLLHFGWGPALIISGSAAGLSLLKGLLAKLTGDPESASFTVGVTGK